MSTSERFRVVADGCAERIEGIGDDQWDLPTPCDGWTVRELVEHLLANLDAVLGAVDRPVTDEPTDAPGTRWRHRADAVLVAMDDPDLAGRPMPSPLGELACNQVVGGVILHDVLVHTWDLARATGQDEVLDPAVVASAHAKMRPFDELLRGPGMFGPQADAPVDADEQARFLAFLGREVAG